LATSRGLEPLTSAVTGRRSNQLNYEANISFAVYTVCLAQQLYT